ncbi:MAG: GGDEF domain-containing protein, partial [Gammaproteobacteria bacterium]|nr:GGDEF domain-containing protein [Gammaproteobacteria bacterium]
VVGDSVLQSLGEIITQSLRENDLAFRYGGEEFAVILPGTDEKGAQFVAERIRSSVEEKVFEPGTLDLKLTI